MIARITGTLEEINPQAHTVLVMTEHLGYEVMVPAYAISDLSARLGTTVTLHCLQIFESAGPSGHLTPRLIGFPYQVDKLFFQRFTSVKGIGMRKALRALARPIADIAAAIEADDPKMLATLPEVGKRTAEQIIAELKGKLTAFAAPAMAAERHPLAGIEREALEILLQLGEKRPDAENYIAAARRADNSIATTDALVQAVYRLKSGSL